MKMKKLLSGFVATTILASSLSLSAFAAVVEGPAINVQASIPNAAIAYGAGATFNVDVDATNAPETGFDMYEFYLKYDGSKVDFTGEDHIDEQGYVDVTEITVAEGDDLAEYIGTGDFVHVLYMNETNVDVTNVSDLGSYPFAVKADATDGNVEFEVYDFNAGQYVLHEPPAEGELFDVVTYEMGTSTPVSATIDTTAPVISGVNSTYTVGDTVSGTVADSTDFSLTLQKGEDEPVPVDTPDGVFSIADLEVGSYVLTATDAAGNKSEVGFAVQAVTDLSVTATLNKYNFKAGDTVEMNIEANFDKISPDGVYAFQVEVPFDSSMFKFTGVKDAAEGVEADVFTTEDGTTMIGLYMDMSDTGLALFQGNDLGTYCFELNDGFETQTSLTVTDALATGSDFKEYYLPENGDFSVYFAVDSVLPVISGVDKDEYVLGDVINFNITDANLDHATITKDGESADIPAEGGVIDYSLRLAPGAYEIKAYDAAGNETVETFNVVMPEDLAIAPEMVGDTTGYPSENGITVNYGSNLLAASNNLGVMALSFEVTYDPAVYDYVGEVADANGWEVYEDVDGHLNVVYFNPEAEDMNTLKTDDLLSLQFENVGANGDTAIKTSNVLAAVALGSNYYQLNTADVADVSAVAVSANVDSAFAQVGDTVNVTVSAGADVYNGYNLAGYQFDLVFDTSRFDLILSEGQENYVTLTDTGATVLFFDENAAAAAPIDTDLITLSLQAKDVEGEVGLVNTKIDLANVNLTYESVDNFAVPVCAVGGTEVNVQYAIDEDGLNIVDVPDGDEMVPAVQFPLGTSQEEAEAMLEEAGLDAEITEYGSGNTMTVNGEEMHMIVMGDVDGDGNVTITDLVAGKAFIFQEADLNAADQCMQAAMDVDFNDAYNVADLLKIKLFILSDIETAQDFRVGWNDNCFLLKAKKMS